MEIITNNKIDQVAWTQASLPLRFAGLGLRKLADLAHPAYFSSVYQSVDLANIILVKYNLSILDDNFNSFIRNYPSNEIPEQPNQWISQNSWDLKHVKLIYDQLMSSSEPTDTARILASSTSESSKWLQAIPSHQLGLLLDYITTRTAIALRLGNKVCERHFCICGEIVSEDGYHGLSCKKKTIPRYSRHAEINKTFSKAFRLRV